MSDRTAVTPLADAIAQRVATGEAKWSDVAREMGWLRDTPDTSRVKRRLGLAVQDSRGSMARTIDYATALRMAEAAGLDPVDCGL